jgi:hypothetical protein
MGVPRLRLYLYATASLLLLSAAPVAADSITLTGGGFGFLRSPER